VLPPGDCAYTAHANTHATTATGCGAADARELAALIRSLDVGIGRSRALGAENMPGQAYTTGEPAFSPAAMCGEPAKLALLLVAGELPSLRTRLGSVATAGFTWTGSVATADVGLRPLLDAFARLANARRLLFPFGDDVALLFRALRMGKTTSSLSHVAAPSFK
jgi:hypothetical protein